MIPLSDIHCHLLAGLDDGPRTDEDSLEMCRLALAEGVQAAAATAHQGERWPLNTPERITAAAGRLSRMLRQAGVALTVFPCAEVMVTPETQAAWREGRLLGMAGRRHYLLIEMPSHLALDLSETVEELRVVGVRPILAHPERRPELLHDPGRIEELVRAGCMIQVSSASLTEPRNRATFRPSRAGCGADSSTSSPPTAIPRDEGRPGWRRPITWSAAGPAAPSPTASVAPTAWRSCTACRCGRPNRSRPASAGSPRGGDPPGLAVRPPLAVGSGPNTSLFPAHGPDPFD